MAQPIRNLRDLGKVGCGKEGTFKEIKIKEHRSERLKYNISKQGEYSGEAGRGPGHADSPWRSAYWVLGNSRLRQSASV